MESTPLSAIEVIKSEASESILRPLSPRTERQDLPPELRLSIDKMVEYEKKLDKRFDLIQDRREKYARHRSPNSYQILRISDMQSQVLSAKKLGTMSSHSGVFSPLSFQDGGSQPAQQLNLPNVSRRQQRQNRSVGRSFMPAKKCEDLQPIVHQSRRTLFSGPKKLKPSYHNWKPLNEQEVANLFQPNNQYGTRKAQFQNRRLQSSMDAGFAKSSVMSPSSTTVTSPKQQISPSGSGDNHIISQLKQAVNKKRQLNRNTMSSLFANVQKPENAGSDLQVCPRDRNANENKKWLQSPMMMKKKKDIESAKVVQSEECFRFIQYKSKQLTKVLEKDSRIVKDIPNGIISKKLKKEFLKTRESLMRRNYLTEANNKIISEWTLDKMLEKAKHKEREEKQIQMALENAKNISRNKPVVAVLSKQKSATSCVVGTRKKAH